MGIDASSTPPERKTDSAVATSLSNGAVAWVKARGRWMLLLLPIGFILGLGVGQIGDRTGEVPVLEAELREVKRQLFNAESDLDVRTDERDRARGQRDVAQRAVEAAEEEMEVRLVELEAREADVAAREAAVGQVEAEVAARSFGTGTHVVGVDIEAGTYRAEASNCYWARLSGLGG